MGIFVDDVYFGVFAFFFFFLWLRGQAVLGGILH